MRVWLLPLCGVLAVCETGWAATSNAGETVEQALCRLIEGAAQRQDLPRGFLTRLIWQESSFRTSVVSPAGAQGVAQFMPGTARERGLADPFDPEQAIPAAAELIAELSKRFGNLGLAAAAYNGGPARVSSWLEGRGELPAETRNYVASITGRSAEEWAEDLKKSRAQEPEERQPEGCLQIVAVLRQPGRGDEIEAPLAPWGVQLAGNFSKARALSSYRRASTTYASVLKDMRPMIIGTRLRYRGTRAFYRVRIPAESRKSGEELCQKIRSLGGSCVVLPS
ncbi:lytic transglycosylase domain-containing protein [Microvirga pakistanensis]|uniref:lytic transglycosylase domain-containing protein n=1 Tax=Microvirga pakistanensis TaxID=1682650 RepID=UPI00106D40E2|nr:lytic transglycosylase domain-containing protein [Microvirga pakistanensis]